MESPGRRYFRYTAPGVLSARLAAEQPTTGVERMLSRTRYALFGRPISSEAELEQRLPKWKALATFSSDAMSSVAYATEASMFTLLAAGTAAFSFVLPISIAVVTVLVIVTFSYRQTIRAYPSGGGSYIVAHANLGMLPGLIAAAALLTDYVLTVAVSVSSGIFALVSAFPAIGNGLELIVVAIIGVMLVNLRGVRESGTLFAGPTYIFVATALLLVAVGIVRSLFGETPHVTGVTPSAVPLAGLSLLLLMRAFADGCSAMTGVEAISNGTPAFKPPESMNARTTMLAMSGLLAVMFLGISYLAGASGAIPSDHESILSQIGRAIFGVGPLYYVLQFSTLGILVLAAQTSFADFPRLSSILARDRFMPRQFAYRGERLAFNNGIVALAVISIVVVVAFGGRVESLIPLYAIGVFTAFTLSQAGMVRHWWRERGPGWRRSMVINGVGATATAIVTVIFAIAKFALGAWVILVIVPVLVLVMWLIHREYDDEAIGIDLRPQSVIGPPNRRQRMIVVAGTLNRAVVQAVKVARTMSGEVEVVHVTSDRAAGEAFRDQFERQVPGIAVTIVESPYRTLIKPLVRYLEVEHEAHPDEVLVVLIPEHIARHWWERLLYNQNAERITAALLGRRNIVVLDAPYRRDS